MMAQCESTPTRSRTRNVSFEARNDVRFTIGAEVDLAGFEPEFPVCRAGVLPLDDRPLAVDRRRFELRFPACDTGVLPLDEQPMFYIHIDKSGSIGFAFFQGNS